MRQNLGGRTFHAERLRDQMRDSGPPEPVTERDTGLTDTQIQTELQHRANQVVHEVSKQGKHIEEF